MLYLIISVQQAHLCDMWEHLHNNILYICMVMYYQTDAFYKVCAYVCVRETLQYSKGVIEADCLFRVTTH